MFGIRGFLRPEFNQPKSKSCWEAFSQRRGSNSSLLCLFPAGWKRVVSTKSASVWPCSHWSSFRKALHIYEEDYIINVIYNKFRWSFRLQLHHFKLFGSYQTCVTVCPCLVAAKFRLLIFVSRQLLCSQQDIWWTAPLHTRAPQPKLQYELYICHSLRVPRSNSIQLWRSCRARGYLLILLLWPWSGSFDFHKCCRIGQKAHIICVGSLP